MKIRYYFMSMMVATFAMTGFTSCDDDDTIIETPDTELTFDAETAKVKIGAENRIALPVATGAGDYRGYSLNPDVAEVVTGEDGQFYIEGYKNGVAKVVVSDAANQYKQLIVSVYTTDEMTLSHSDYNFVTPLGLSSTSNECSVVLGNGEYTVESDNAKVEASINPETGVISLTATSGKDEYTANITVTDCSNLSATIKVTVSATFDAFTDADINNLLGKTKNEVYIKSSQFSQNEHYYFRYESWGSWKDEAGSDNLHTFGWWYGSSWSDYGGHYIIYPEDAAINEEVNGTYRFKYFYGYDLYNLEGKVKVIKDDATAKIVIWWDVDMDNEVINRGWIVKIK